MKIAGFQGLSRVAALVAVLSLTQVAGAADSRLGRAADEDSCDCAPAAARGGARSNSRGGVPAPAFGGFGFVLPTADADVYGEVDREGQTVTVTFLVFGFGDLTTEVVDCCIQGDLVQADYSIAGLAGSDSDSQTFTSPATASFTSPVALFAIVSVDIQYPETTVFPAGFDVLSGFDD